MIFIMSFEAITSWYLKNPYEFKRFEDISQEIIFPQEL